MNIIKGAKDGGLLVEKFKVWNFSAGDDMCGGFEEFDPYRYGVYLSGEAHDSYALLQFILPLMKVF